MEVLELPIQGQLIHLNDGRICQHIEMHITVCSKQGGNTNIEIVAMGVIDDFQTASS